MKYNSLIKWEGSPNGTTVKQYDADCVYDHSEIGDDLAQVALELKWIEVADAPKKDAPKKEEPKMIPVTIEIIKDGMTVKEMKSALTDAGITTTARKEDTLAKLILKHELFEV